MKKKILARNFVVVAGDLTKGNTLIFTTSSHIHYIVDVIEYADSNNTFVKIHRPNSVHYLCSISCEATALCLESVGLLVSHLIEKYDL